MVTQEDVVQVAEYLHIEIDQSIIDETIRRFHDLEINEYIDDRFRAIEIVIYGIIL
jgi:hypothetical protein